MSLPEKNVKDQQSAAAADGDIGHVEDRPHAKVEKIDHISFCQPVDEISHSAGDDEGEGQTGHPMQALPFQDQITQQSRYGRSADDQQERLTVLQDAEGRAEILDIGDVKNTVDHGYALIQRYSGLYEIFCELIGCNQHCDD